MIQLRLKRASPAELVAVARRLLETIAVPVLINDRVDVALAAKAHGVHLGPDDLPPARVRAIVPEGFIIGASVGSADEVGRAGSADYWGVGPWRATATKVDAGPALGASGFAAVARLAGEHPCVAIGAIEPEDFPLVVDAGGVGVAVVSGIFGAADIEAAARRYAIW